MSCSDPPAYDVVFKNNNLPSSAPPTVPLLVGTTFTNIFGGTTTTVQFEWNAATPYTGFSFVIRDMAGSVQAKGDKTMLCTTVRNVNGTDMLNIVKETNVNQNGENNSTVDKFSVINDGNEVGFVKVMSTTTSGSTPSHSFEIFDRNGTPIVVKSLVVGDYAIFRTNSMVAPMCNLQMPSLDTYRLQEFNIKMIFHPESGITREEQLLCTAAAIVFKSARKETIRKRDSDNESMAWIWIIVIVMFFILLFMLL
ncbi:hypothetical protein Bhyg_00816 [Pseudolycoriella hygida]|uniref:Uncharacterized protein n=1 Tax=Pseudolycoriella hygida TaxID=35572 RepID=A0A9Q0S5A6_9DIPT|nr:hypothetical protein Bhyg_00816 [Pseudolycoriella hygida]